MEEERRGGGDSGHAAHDDGSPPPPRALPTLSPRNAKRRCTFPFSLHHSGSASQHGPRSRDGAEREAHRTVGACPEIRPVPGRRSARGDAPASRALFRLPLLSLSPSSAPGPLSSSPTPPPPPGQAGLPQDSSPAWPPPPGPAPGARSGWAPSSGDGRTGSTKPSWPTSRSRPRAGPPGGWSPGVGGGCRRRKRRRRRRRWRRGGRRWRSPRRPRACAAAGAAAR